MYQTASCCVDGINLFPEPIHELFAEVILMKQGANLDSKARQMIHGLCEKLHRGDFSEYELSALFLLIREHVIRKDAPLRWFADALAHRNRTKSAIYAESLGVRAISVDSPPDILLNEQRSLNQDKDSRSLVQQIVAGGKEKWLQEAKDSGPLFQSGTLFESVNETLISLACPPIDVSLRDVLELMALSVVQGITFGENFSRIYLVRSQRKFTACIGPRDSVSIHLNLMTVADPSPNPSSSLNWWTDDVLVVSLSDGIVITKTLPTS